jgi:hypothetical protein
MSVVVGVLGVPRSPGASTLALAMGCADPSSTVIEADPSGGRIALSYGINVTPGLPEFAVLASAGERAVASDPVRVLGCGTRVVPAPLDGQVVAGVARQLSHPGVDLASVSRGPVLLDLGRMPAGPDTWSGLAARCDAIVLVGRCDIVSLGLATRLVPELRASGRVLGLALVRDGMCEPASSAAQLGLPLFGAVAYRPRHAARLWHACGPQTRRNNVIVNDAAGVLAAVAAVDRFPVMEPATV